MVLLVGVAVIVLSTKLSGGEPQVFGHQMKTVLSGSMEPGIQTGSIIAVKPVSDGNNLNKNDVITFKEDADTLITHRIIEVTETKNGSLDRKSTRLNSSHVAISYAVFCLKKKKK